MLQPKHHHPRIFATADIQAQDFAQFSGPDAQGFDTRLAQLLERIDQAIEAFHTEKPLDAIVFNGDSLDNRSAVTLPVIELFTRYARKWAALAPVVFVVGNHEQYKKAHSDISSLSMFEPYCTVIRKAGVMKIAGQLVGFSPFESDLKKVYIGLDEIAATGAKLLFGHWTVAGCTTGNEVMEHGVLRDYSALKAFDLILLGDIHLCQALNERMMYLGSPQQHDFGERGDKHVWLLDGTTLTSFETQLPKFHRVDTLEEAKTLRAQGHYVELRATDKASAEAGVELGVRVDRAYTETVASEDRPALAGYKEAVRWWAEKNLPASKVDAMVTIGLSFFEGLKGTGFPQEQWIIGKVKGRNVMSYETIEFDLSKAPGFIILNGVVQVAQQCDSNGAGKTTLYETVNIALFGQSLRSGKSLAQDIREGAEEMETDITIRNKDGNREYRIVRTVPGGLKFFFRDPQTGSAFEDISLGGAPATQNKIVEVFGDDDLFHMATLLALHTCPSFLRRDEADKKAFIDRASGLAVFDDAQERVKAFIKEVEAVRTETRTLVTVAETKLGGVSRLVEAAETAHAAEVRRVEERRTANLKAAEDKRSMARSLAEPKAPEAPDVTQNTAWIEELETSVVALKLDVGRAELNLSAAEQDLATMRVEEADTVTGYAELEKGRDEARASLADTRLQLTTWRSGYEAKSKMLAAREITLKNESTRTPKAGDVCKSCGYVYTGQEDASLKRQHLEEEARGVAAELAALKAENEPILKDGDEAVAVGQAECAAWDVKITALNVKATAAKEKVRKASDTVASCINALNVAKEKVRQGEALVKDAVSAASRTTAIYETQVKAHADRLAAHQAEVGRLLAEADAKATEAIPSTADDLAVGVETQKKALAEAHAKLAKHNADLGDLTSQLEALEFWNKAFGNKGCKSLLYTAVIDTINDHIRRHSHIVSGGMFSIRLLPYSETAKGTVTEKLSVQVENAVGSSRIKGNSLGETTRVDIPVNLAIRDLIRDKGLTWNLLFADEPWMGLDESGKKSIYSLLSSVKVTHGSVIVTDQSEFSKGNIAAHQWTAKKTLVNGKGRSELLLHADAPDQTVEVHLPETETGSPTSGPSA